MVIYKVIQCSSLHIVCSLVRNLAQPHLWNTCHSPPAHGHSPRAGPCPQPHLACESLTTVFILTAPPLPLLPHSGLLSVMQPEGNFEKGKGEPANSLSLKALNLHTVVQNRGHGVHAWPLPSSLTAGPSASLLFSFLEPDCLCSKQSAITYTLCNLE